MIVVLLQSVLHAAEQKETYGIVPGQGYVNYDVTNGADDDYILKLTVSGSWAEVDMSGSMEWSGSAGSYPTNISDCPDSSDPSYETFSFTGSTDPIASADMHGDGWFGYVAECGGTGTAGGSPPTWDLDIEDDREFGVRVPPKSSGPGETAALVGERLPLQGYTYQDGGEPNGPTAAADWNPPADTDLFSAASGGSALSGTALENLSDVYAEASKPGKFEFEATLHTDSQKSGEEELTFYSLNLNIEGVADEDEVDPGGYIIAGTNNLQRINVVLNPNRMDNKDITLTVDEGAGVVKIWENSDGTQSVISDSQSEKKWLGSAEVPEEMYVEMLSTSTESQVNLELSYADHSGNTNGVDQIKINKLKIESVDWLDNAENLITEINDHPTAGVGLKYYPGAMTPSENWNDLVKIRVSIEPAISGVGVYLKIIDPDDPSADDDSVDNDTDGGDNRGAELLIETYQETDQNGQIIVDFLLSHHPGDNYRVAASLNEENLDDINDNNISADNAQLVSFSGVVSNLLTVWRRLHIEHDSMEEEFNNYTDKQPDINRFIGESVIINSPIPGQTTIDTFGPIFSPSEDFYEGGSIKKFGPYKVISNTNNALLGDQIVLDGVLTAADISSVVDKLVRIYDDDPSEPQLPYYHDLTGFVRTVYKQAYIWIEPVNDTLNTDKEVPFNLNLTYLELQFDIDYDNGRNLLSSNKFWVSLLVTAYQGLESGDGDADLWDGNNNSVYPSSRSTSDAGFLLGATVEDSENASVFFIETCRDIGEQISIDLDHVIAHEIGHAGGPSESDTEAEHQEYGIMADAKDFRNEFSHETLKRFRDALKW